MVEQLRAEVWQMIEIIYGFCLGICVGAVGMIIYDIEKTKRFWRKMTLGMTDFDIKCMNEEYARRKSKC
jgi:hypothetical protein